MNIPIFIAVWCLIGSVVVGLIGAFQGDTIPDFGNVDDVFVTILMVAVWPGFAVFGLVCLVAWFARGVRDDLAQQRDKPPAEREL